ncbi:hypothetical protein EWM64_g4420 [Hericium alpestre]|uniref:Uncharacterized protein n=1 Tax=Hericium alpestre TaxID=135208 RepID=A0A4Y9ZZW1_9AGAM|nr:hypothetical protein EWM64_g4420 [Hericium alpestre]
MRSYTVAVAVLMAAQVAPSLAGPLNFDAREPQLPDVAVSKYQPGITQSAAVLMARKTTKKSSTKTSKTAESTKTSESSKTETSKTKTSKTKTSKTKTSKTKSSKATGTSKTSSSSKSKATGKSASSTNTGTISILSTSLSLPPMGVGPDDGPTSKVTPIPFPDPSGTDKTSSTKGGSSTKGSSTKGASSTKTSAKSKTKTSSTSKTTATKATSKRDVGPSHPTPFRDARREVEFDDLD